MMMQQLPITAPLIFLSSMICLTLLLCLIFRKHNMLSYYLAQLGLIGTGLLFLKLPQQVATAFHGFMLLDPLAHISSLLIIVMAIFALSYAKPYIKSLRRKSLEFDILTLFAVLGMLVMVASQNLITIYLGLELLSLPLYALVALRRTGQSIEAAMKYFAMGALASAMLLYGLSMIYGLCGSLDLSIIAHTIAAIPSDHQLLGIIGLVFLIAGLAFKFGAAPFHLWTPDVYEAAPISVVALIGSAPKIAVLVMTLRIFGEAFVSLVQHWQTIWIVIAIASMALGNIAAIMQNNICRMLAYSAIAHMGYMSLGFLSGSHAGYAASLFYVISYSIMTLAAFGGLIAMSNQGFEIKTLEDLRGLNWRNPWLAFMMLIVMFSMAGIPPSVGFFAKMGVLEALIGVHLSWLAVLALIFAIIGAYYYLRIVKTMYFEAQEEYAPIVTSFESRAIMSVNALVILALGVFPSQLIDTCRHVFGV